jgi:hypothetical protein
VVQARLVAKGASAGTAAAVQARLAARGLVGGTAAAAAGACDQPAARQYNKMIIARVALGKQTTGQAGMRRPPDGYDSVNSGTAGARRGRSTSKPYCHVIFDNDQCYPEYLITLTP